MAWETPAWKHSDITALSAVTQTDTLGSDFCHQKSSDTAGHPAMGFPGVPVSQFPQIAV